MASEKRVHYELHGKVSPKGRWRVIDDARSESEVFEMLAEYEARWGHEWAGFRIRMVESEHTTLVEYTNA